MIVIPSCSKAKQRYNDHLFIKNNNHWILMYKNTYVYTQKSIFLVLFHQLKPSNIGNLLNIYKVHKNTFFFFFFIIVSTCVRVL